MRSPHSSPSTETAMPARRSAWLVALQRVSWQSPLASLTLALASPGWAQSADGSTLDKVIVRGAKTSDTQPVPGYKARQSSSSTRTDTPLIDTPQSISVITQDVIKDQSVQSLADAVRYVPGVSAAQGEGNRDALIFRGNASTGDFFVDGLRDDVQTYRDVYNTDRIEVLKGANGLAFGRGGAGGVINRVSKEAGWDPLRNLSLSYGTDDHRRAAIDLGQGVNDSVAWRLNSVYEKSDSYRAGVKLERYGIAPTVTIRPSSRTRIVLGGEYFKDERIADRGVPSANGSANAALNRRPFRIHDDARFFGSADRSPTQTETYALNLAIEHAFDNGVTIKSRTRYADYDKYYQNVFADSAVANNGNFTVRGYRDDTDRENLLNQTDLSYTARWAGIEHKLLASLELSRQDTDNSRVAGFFSNDLTTTGTQVTLNANTASQIGSTPVTFAPNLVNGNNAFRDNSSNVDVIGVTLQDQLTFNPQWQAILGVRYDHFETKFRGSRRRGGSTNANDLISERFDVTDNFVSPRAGLIYKPRPDVSLYISYSVSYVPRAGDQLTSLTPTTEAFDPEKFINIELGAKWDVNTDLALTFAVYQLDREKVAITNPSNASETILVDGQETKGVELGVAGKLTSRWSVFGGYAYQDGEVTKQQGSGAGAILKGAELGQTPAHTMSLWNRYDFDAVWGAAIGVIARSNSFAQSPTASQSIRLPGYARVDAALYGQFSKQLRLQLNLENLTGRDYALYAHNNNNITPGSPFAARATLIYSF